MTRYRKQEHTRWRRMDEEMKRSNTWTTLKRVGQSTSTPSTQNARPVATDSGLNSQKLRKIENKSEDTQL
jgi:hypothetical protein